MILTACNDITVLEMMIVINTILNVIKLVVPALIILICMLDLTKSITGRNEDAIKAAQKRIPKRLASAMVMYLIPTLIALFMQLIDDSFEYTACFTNASKGHIEELKSNMVNEKMTEISALLSTGDYKSHTLKYMANDALTTINKLEDESARKEWTAKVADFIKQADEKYLKEIIENTPDPFLTINLKAYEPPDKAVGGAGPIPDPNNRSGGVLTYYKQGEGSWGKKTYSGGTYSSHGCGATSLAMIVSSIGNNPNADPSVIGDKIRAMGLPTTDNSHDAFTNPEFLASFGIKGTKIANGTSKDASIAKFREVLSQNKPIIINAPGHYVVLDHMKGDQFHIMDPAREKYNHYYTADELWQQIIINYENRNSPRYAYFYYEKL